MFSEVLIPLALALTAFGGYYAYNRYQSQFVMPKGPITVPVKVFTAAELSKYDGAGSNKCYLAVKGIVYDVSDKKEYYGPGQSYSVFAAKDASAALGKSSVKPEDCTWDYSTLGAKELQTLDQWAAFYHQRYKMVGRTDKYVEPETPVTMPEPAPGGALPFVSQGEAKKDK